MLGFGKKPAAMAAQWQMELEESVVCVGWAVREGRLAAMPAEGKIVVLDGRSGKVQRELPGHRMGNNGMVWSNDGSLLVTCGQDGKLNGWRAATGEQAFSVSPGGKWIDHVAWSNAYRSIAVADGKFVRVYKDTGVIALETPEHESPVSAVAWSADGKLLATGCFGGIRVWDPVAAKCIQTMEVAEKITMIQWSPSGKFIAAGSQADMLFIGTRNSDHNLHMSGYPSRTRALSWTQDSQLLASTGGKAVIIWSFAGAGPEGSRPKILERHAGSVTQTAFAGPRLASACDQGTLNVWDVKSWSQTHAADLAGAVHAMAWRPDNQMLVTGDANGRLSAFEVKN
jgi:WD40 repeat protein